MTEKGLTERMKKFAAEFCVDFNATRAAIAAGCPKKSAQVLGSRMLRDNRVKRLIGYYQSRAIKQAEINAEEVLFHLWACVTRSAEDFCDEEGKLITDVNRLSKRAQCAVDGIEQEVLIERDRESGDIIGERIKTKLKLVPKASAIDMALKHKGLYAALEQNINQNVTVNWDEMAVRQPAPTCVVGPAAIDALVTRRLELEESNDAPLAGDGQYNVDELAAADED